MNPELIRKDVVFTVRWVYGLLDFGLLLPEQMRHFNILSRPVILGAWPGDAR